MLHPREECENAELTYF